MFEKFQKWLAEFINGLGIGKTDFSGLFSQLGENLKGFLGNLFEENFGREYDNNQTPLSNVFGTNLGDLLRALTNRLTAGHLTGAEQEANAFNAEQAQINRDFEERMASTQFQRQVSDMQAAGVNPALAMQGSGNAAPSGVAASSTQPSGPAFNMSELMQMLLVKPQMKLLDSQAHALRENAESNRISAEASSSQASSAARNAETNALLANNQIKIGDSLVTLNSSKMEQIAQDIKESASRVELQQVEKAAKELNYQFDKDTFEANKELVMQQILYRAVEMSEMRSVVALNAKLKENAEKQGEILDAEKVGERLSAEWKEQNPHFFKILDTVDMGAEAIGHILHFGFNFGRNKSKSSSTSNVDVRSTSHNYQHKSN